MTPGAAAQLVPIVPENGIPTAKAGQDRTGPDRAALFEGFHVATCHSVAAELKARAFDLRTKSTPQDWREAESYSERAALWIGLADRIGAVKRNPLEPVGFTHNDVELVRYYRLVQLRKVTDNRDVKRQRTRQLDALFHALYAVLLPFERAKVDREMAP